MRQQFLPFFCSLKHSTIENLSGKANKKRYDIRDFILQCLYIFSSIRNQFRQVVFHCAYRIDVHRWMEFSTRFSYTQNVRLFYVNFQCQLSSIRRNQIKIERTQILRAEYLHRNIKRATIHDADIQYSLLVSFNVGALFCAICRHCFAEYCYIRFDWILFIIYLARVDRHFVMIYTRHFHKCDVRKSQRKGKRERCEYQ